MRQNLYWHTTAKAAPFSKPPGYLQLHLWIRHKNTILTRRYSNFMEHVILLSIKLQGITMRKSFLDAQKIFQNHSGILRTGQAKRLGIDTKTIADMHEAELLQRLGRGLYRLSELPPLQYPDLVQVALRVPQAVICLISALAFHNLTIEIPHKVYIALPQTVRQPRFNYPPLDVVWLSKAGYEAGIEEQRLDGVVVPIYEKSKTIADCFKFRTKVGKEVAVEALKEYVHLPDANIGELLHYAQIDRVEQIMRPYLDAVL